MFKRKKKTKTVEGEEKEDQSQTQSQTHSRTQSVDERTETRSNEMRSRTSSAVVSNSEEEKNGDKSGENSSVAATESVMDPYINDPTTWVEPDDSEDENEEDAVVPVRYLLFSRNYPDLEEVSQSPKRWHA
jgi:hypothetical protein